ncbi:MAG: M4 family metallopeptidase [Proteobacteria bacterium]|nr:M4 family metallopeptidase [Pseudomonadota bacterium]MBU1688257.1 M4 family metallopeptidase [Pseudomonadota bacterium]
MKKRSWVYLLISSLAVLLLLGSQASAFGPHDHDDDDRSKKESVHKSKKKGFKTGHVKEREPVRKRTKKTKSDDGVLREDALKHARKKIKGNDLKFERSQEKTDRLGFKHIHLTESYKGIPIVGAEYIVHMDADDNIFATSESFTPDLSLDVTPTIDVARAIEIISADFLEDISAKIILPPSLVIYGEELAYTCIFADIAAPYEMHYFVNAQSGEVIGKFNNIQFGTPSQGNGVSIIDTINGARLSGEDGSVQVLENGWFDTSDSSYYLFSFDNLWGVFDTDTADWANSVSPNWGTSDPAAISTALNFEVTQKYVTTIVGRDSFNDQGAFAQANIHYSTNYANAYWNGIDFTFGDGSGSSIGPLTTLDIVAHEYGHAVTQYTSNLTYSYESGALNESYSDIFGSLVEFYAQPDGRGDYPNSTPGYADWLEGEDAWIGSALRDMRNPQRFVQPSYYHGNMWYTGTGDNGGVHYNSGVQNHAFYLLAEGGSGTNDGHAYGPIAGLGIEAAGEIALYANMNFLTASSDHYDARDAWILAAETLGYTAGQVQAVSDAWVACGVSPVRIDAPSPLPNAAMGEAYSLQMVVTGAVGGYTCSLASGDVLPAGLTLDPSLCEVSGITAIQSAGIYPVGIEVVDSIGMPASRIVPINVVSPVKITAPSPVPVAYLAQPYSAQMVVTGAVDPYVCAVTSGYSLPAGLTLDSATCEISGVTAIQTTGYKSTRINVVDAIGMSAYVSFSIRIVSPITIQLPNPVPFPIVNEPFSMQVTATGAVGSYSCSATSLPTGLSMDSTTCTVSGTPITFGSRQAVLTVVDSLGIPGTLSVLFDVFDESKLLEASTTTTAGQSWIDVETDASGNIYAATQAAVSKYTPQLDLLWSMPFTGTIQAISVTSAGNILVTGKGGTTGGDFLTGMYDSDQNEIWLRSYPGGALLKNSKLTIDGSGTIYIAGMVSDTAAAQYKFVIFKYDQSGVATPFLEMDAFHANSGVAGIVTDSDGNVYLTNDYGSSYGNSGLLSKYNSDGFQLWNTTIWNYYYQYMHGLTIDTDNNLYVGLYGYTGSQYRSDFRSFTSDGAERWRKYLSLPGQTYESDLTMNTYGVLSVLVHFTGGTNSFDIATLVNRDPSQGVVWGIETYDSGLTDYSYAVSAGPNGEFVVAGRAGSSGVLIRYESTNNDVDGDGYDSVEFGGTDCNDNDPLINPGAEEICDEMDNNCNDQIDEGVTTTYYLDNDSDGYGDFNSPAEACSLLSGYSTDDTDCNDLDFLVNPGAAEICDEIDNNCNGQIDEGVTTTYYLDSDLDGYGDFNSPTEACSLPSGYSVDATDCNDDDSLVNPGAEEICDEVDNNCNGQVDEGVTTTYYLDSDLDGYGDFNSPVEACSLPSGYSADATDCNDDDSLVNPGAEEICDEVDNNCNGQIDEGVTTTYWLDNDLDGFGDNRYTVEACTQPSGHASEANDCYDFDNSIYPGAPEINGDGIDQDCNGYDLSIEITRAEYDDHDEDFDIRATSDLGSSANLVVEGYGPMDWNSSRNRWQLTIHHIQANEVPASITVSGIEGSVTMEIGPVMENTIAITRAEYDDHDEELDIRATSDLGSDADLVVEGFGAMSWNSYRQRWELIIDHLDGDEVPSTVTVSGPEGSVTVNVTNN